MMDAKTTRDQVVRDAKSTLILDAALKVFSEKGFHEARLDDIAVAAGFSKASLYNYYEDKESIFLNLLIRMHEKIIETLSAGIQKDQHILENLTSMLRSILKIYYENFSFSMTMSDLKSMAPVSIEKFQKHHESLMMRFKEHSAQMLELSVNVFSNARARGEIKSSIDDKTLAEFVTALIHGVLFDCKARGKIEIDEKLISNIREFLVKGIGIFPKPM